MPYSYKELTGDNLLPELKDTVNDIGKYLENDSISNVKTISRVDFNNVTEYVDSTGNYYSTNSINTPVNARPHGFFSIYIRDGNYYKILYSPHNSSDVFIRTYNFGTLSDWEQVKLDQPQYSVNNSIDPTGLNGTQTLYGTLTKPPKSNLSEGWVVYLEGTNKSQSLLTFYPKDSSSVFVFDRNKDSWNEYNSKKQLSSSLPVDSENDNYFKYRFWKNDVGSKSMFDLLYELPQGFHTVYLQAGIKDLPSSQSVRGIVNVDNHKGDISRSSKFIRVTLFDDDSKQYNFYCNNSSWGVPMTTESRYTLWTGELDLGSTNTTISLKDSIDNYDMLEITYLTLNTSSHKTIRYNLRTGDYSSLYIKDINLANNDSSSLIDLFEGFLQIINSKSISPGMSKRVVLDSSLNSSKVASFNQLGEIVVYQIAGIKNV